MERCVVSRNNVLLRNTSVKWLLVFLVLGGSQECYETVVADINCVTPVPSIPFSIYSNPESNHYMPHWGSFVVDIFSIVQMCLIS